MVDSRDKGARAELAVRDELRKLTGHKWERVPSSGALSPIHLLKGDLLIDWWNQTLRQASQVNKEPLLLFKHDRSKIFAARLQPPETGYRNILVDYIDTIMYISLLQDWVTYDKPKFII